ncbi:hypothetical protein GEMRC1_010786 [Eukaryota sp. GEM-RC1]
MKVQVNDTEFTALIDSACETSCFAADVAKKAQCVITESRMKFTLVNGETITSSDTAECILTFEFDRMLSPRVYLKSQIPFIPGKELFLVGCDILASLGLLKDNSLVIQMNNEHTKFTNAEATMDHLIIQPPKPTLTATLRTEPIDLSESRIELPAAMKSELTALLEQNRDIFGKPHPDGIKCVPMNIPFYDETATCIKSARQLNPNKLRIANEILDELIEDGFTEECSVSNFSSPIVPVICPDGKKPRLTGTIPISDISLFLTGSKLYLYSAQSLLAGAT